MKNKQTFITNTVFVQSLIHQSINTREKERRERHKQNIKKERMKEKIKYIQEKLYKRKKEGKKMKLNE